MLVGWALKRKLTSAQRHAVVMHILDNVHALPLSAIIDTDEDGGITVNNRVLDIETSSQLREHARSALDNKALILIREQVKYQSYVGAATKAANADDLTFYRAALWFGQEVEKYLILLAGREEPTLD